jgi:futalosine hydrolase
VRRAGVVGYGYPYSSAMPLLVAATAPELCGAEGLVCGVGPVEAAATVAAALQRDRPDAVVHVGIAGARGISPGTVVIGAEAVYCDLAAAFPLVDRAAADPLLLEAARRALPNAPVVRIGTSAAVGGVAHDVPVEAMEGFGVLRAAALAGVPALEVRSVSNEIGEGDRSLWQIDEALEALAAVLPVLLASASAALGSRAG